MWTLCVRLTGFSLSSRPPSSLLSLLQIPFSKPQTSSHSSHLASNPQGPRHPMLTLATRTLFFLQHQLPSPTCIVLPLLLCSDSPSSDKIPLAQIDWDSASALRGWALGPALHSGSSGPTVLLISPVRSGGGHWVAATDCRTRDHDSSKHLQKEMAPPPSGGPLYWATQALG